MQSLPIFISSVANSTDDPVFPVLFAWSTMDGQIKEVLVTPDDDWLDENEVEPNLFDIDTHQLYEFGYEASDILAEWSSELDTDAIYALDHELTESMVTAIYDIKGMDASVEVLPVSQWFEERGVSFRNAIHSMDLSQPLDLLAPDEQVGFLLRMAVEHNLIETSFGEDEEAI